MPQRQRYSAVKVAGFYLAMPVLETYARIRGIYRQRFPLLQGPYKNFPSPNTGPVLCFGDSLTAGYGSDGNRNFPAFLDKKWSSLGINVINQGRNGDTALDGLARLSNEVLKFQPAPRCVIIGFGGNDLLQRLPIQTTDSALRVMIEEIQGMGAGVILLGLRGSWLYKIDYEEPFYQLAKETGCALVPVCLDYIWGNPWLMHDPAHPNGRGYEKLADRILKVAEPLLF